MVAGKLGRIESVRRLQDARIVERVVSGQVQPARQACLTGKVDSAGAGEVRIEEKAEARRSAGDSDAASVCGGGNGSAKRKADDVVETARKIFAGEAEAIRKKPLLDAGCPRLAGLRFERRIAEVAKVVAVDLVEPRLL